MKTYTDLEQSKKLAEFLPLESADMCYPYDRHLNKMYGDIPYAMGYKRFNEDTDFPCWSLSALLDVIPKHIKDYNVLRIDISDNDFAVWYDGIGCGVNDDLPDITADNSVDACVEMIIKLNELKML